MLKHLIMNFLFSIINFIRSLKYGWGMETEKEKEKYE